MPPDVELVEIPIPVILTANSSSWLQHAWWIDKTIPNPNYDEGALQACEAGAVADAKSKLNALGIDNDLWATGGGSAAVILSALWGGAEKANPAGGLAATIPSFRDIGKMININKSYNAAVAQCGAQYGNHRVTYHGSRH